MDYYGLLFLYYLKGLSGKSVLRLFFNIEVGGTEQLLPENTSTPTTTPILADIQYPDGLRTDQYFTYRETPTTVSNKARIKTIKGNTLVWNQLVQEVSSIYWENGSSIASSSFANGECKFTASAIYGYVALKGSVRFAIPTGHKVLMLIDVKAPVGSKFIVGYGSPGSVTSTGIAKNNVDGTGSYQTISILGTWRGTYANYPVLVMDTSTSNWSEIAFKNVMLFDLTAMFGSGNEPSTVEEFTSLFPLSYYSYNQGSLLSFNGNGIKTVGFNQWDEELEQGFLNTNTGQPVTSTSYSRSKNFIPILPNEQYYCKALYNVYVFYYDANKNYLGFETSSVANKIFTPLYQNAHYIKFRYDNSGASYNNDSCINISSSKNGTYEPYTSSTLSLPISTYFPNGMDGIANVHDELTSSSYVKKFSTVTVDGSENWIKSSSYEGNYYARILVDAKLYIGKAVSTFTRNIARNVQELAQYDNCIFIDGESSRQTLNIKNSSISTLENFKAWLASNPVTVCYELATPTETPITTEDANEALSLLMGKSVSSNNANQMINIITKGE